MGPSNCWAAENYFHSLGFAAAHFEEMENREILGGRLDRQLRIPGWNQLALEKAKIAVVGDADLLASLYILSASALGINQIRVISPRLDSTLVNVARRVNHRLRLIHLEGYYTHPLLDDFLRGCNLVVDLSSYGLANKLLLDKAFKERLPVVRGFLAHENGRVGLRVFTYLRGREWQELGEIIAPRSLPASHFDDGVLDMITAGIVLEESKKLLAGQEVSEEIVQYRRDEPEAGNFNPAIAIVGAGALGNFVGLGLGYSGYTNLTIIDPDRVELTNLNRQVLFFDSIGQSKAETLAKRLNQSFDIEAKAEVFYFRGDTDIARFDVIFDCVDNFETRVVLSKKCRAEEKILISGGTHVASGQVIVYDPRAGRRTPAELLGLEEIVAGRQGQAYERLRESCLYRPEPSVIMTNQVIAGFMVDCLRRVLAGQNPPNIFYESTSSRMIYSGEN